MACAVLPLRAALTTSLRPPVCSELVTPRQRPPEGDFYRIRRPALQPGGEEQDRDPQVYLAAVNPVMTAVAGEVADALAAHPFATEDYIRDVLRPALEAGARRAARPTPGILLQLVVAPSREIAAQQMTAYTVPAYRRVLDHHGLGAVADQVMAASREGRRSEARQLIDERYLDLLGVIVGDDVAAVREGIERWRPHADRLSLSVPWFGIEADEQLRLAERLIELVAGLGTRG